MGENKGTVSQIDIWKGKGASYNVAINELGIMLVVHQKRQPKSYQRIEDWLKSENTIGVVPAQLYEGDIHEE